MLLQTDPMIAVPDTGRGPRFLEVLSPKAAHIIGLIVFLLGLGLVALYIYARATARRVGDLK